MCVIKKKNKEEEEADYIYYSNAVKGWRGIQFVLTISGDTLLIENLRKV
jgi:hypothetical protein